MQVHYRQLSVIRKQTNHTLRKQEILKHVADNVSPTFTKISLGLLKQ